MTKFSLPRAVHLACLPALCTALVACSNGSMLDFTGKDDKTQQGDDASAGSHAADGALALTLDGEIANAPGETLLVEIVDAAGKAQVRKVSGDKGKLEIKGLAYGLARLKATVSGADGKAIFEGTGEAKIAKGIASTLSLTLREVEAGGSLVIVIEKPKPVRKHSLLKLSTIGSDRITLRASQALSVCNGFETSIWGKGKQTFIDVKSCAPFGAGPGLPMPEPLPPGMVHTTSKASKPAVDPSSDPLPLPPIVQSDAQYVRQYEIKGASIGKVIALLNAIEATEKPEVAPAIACLPRVGERTYSVQRVIGGDVIMSYSAKAPGSGCAWNDDFRVDTLIKANDALTSLARQEGELVSSTIDPHGHPGTVEHVGRPSTGGPGPLPAPVK